MTRHTTVTADKDDDYMLRKSGMYRKYLYYVYTPILIKLININYEYNIIK